MNNIEDGIDGLDTIIADQVLPTYTTGGTDTAFTVTTLAATDLTTNERWKVKFNATAGATPTLNRDSKGAKALKYYDSTGAKVACGATSIIANMISDVEYDGTDYVLLNRLIPSAARVLIRLLDKDTSCNAGTTIGGDIRLALTGTIIDCGLYHDTAGVTGTEITDIHLAGTTIMTTNKIACATGQKSSEDGGATQPTITTSAYTENAILTVDIDTAHSGTAAKGLVIWLKIREN